MIKKYFFHLQIFSNFWSNPGSGSGSGFGSVLTKNAGSGSALKSMRIRNTDFFQIFGVPRKEKKKTIPGKTLLDVDLHYRLPRCKECFKSSPARTNSSSKHKLLNFSPFFRGVGEGCLRCTFMEPKLDPLIQLNPDPDAQLFFLWHFTIVKKTVVDLPTWKQKTCT